MAHFFQGLAVLTLPLNGWAGIIFFIVNGQSFHGKYCTITGQRR